jgi:hypothetical protein
MTEVKVNAGVCGFQTIIRVTSEDMQTAVIEMDTQCPKTYVPGVEGGRRI